MPRTLRQKRKDKDRQGLYVFGAVIAAALLLVGLYFVAASNRIATDPNTLCPETGSYPHTIVLVDKTDAFTASQRRLLGTVIRDVGAELKQFEKLSIFVLDDQNFRAPTPSFALCNPGDGSEANQLYENPRKIQAKFEATFGEPLDRAIEALAMAETAPRSPIMEMIEEVAIREDMAGAARPQRLILFSDMLQHMPSDYSQFQDPVDFEWFEASPYAASVKTNLGGASVEIVYLLHEDYVKRQTRRHIIFWERYIRWISGDLQEVRPVR
jgi:hypothetical protein